MATHEDAAIDEILADLPDDEKRPMAAIFIERSIPLLRRLALQAPSDVLRDSLGAPTDVGTLTRVLSQAASEESVRALDPLAEAFARAAEIQEELLKQAGGTWTVSEVAKHLQVSRQAVDKRRARGSLLALEVGDMFRYPLCQFDDTGVIAGLSHVLRAMPTESAWTKLSLLFTLTLKGEKTTVLEAVRQDRLEDALHAVRSWGEQGAV